MSVSLLIAAAASKAAARTSLAERLGYKPTDKLLIVNGDDAGMCHSANLATTEALEKGLMRCATIMVPCPRFPEIAAYAKAHPDKDFGVHLCHTSEWGKYRWGPVAPRDEVPGLIDAEGYLWRGILEVYAHASPEQALIEGRTQIQRALAAGIDVTHLDSHMGTLQLHPEYVKPISNWPSSSICRSVWPRRKPLLAWVTRNCAMSSRRKGFFSPTTLSMTS